MNRISRLSESIAVLAVLAVASACATAPRSSPADTRATASSPASSSPASSSPAPLTDATPVPKSVAVTTVILVRHAEKVDASSDPELSPAGMERAQLLVDIVRNAKVTSIITTQFRRTRATAEPAASALEITPVVIASPGALHASVVADSVRAHAGEALLVVGHSNTVPAIIAALGGPTQPPICDSEYDDLFVLVLPADGRAPVLVRSRYGAASPRGVGCPRMK